MSSPPINRQSLGPAVEAHFLGLVDFRRCLAVQEQLAAEAAVRDDGQIRLLLCEHPPIVTVGRAGTAEQLSIDSGLLRSRRLEVCWVKRGGGVWVHAPGQLSVYPIVPLRWHGFSVGQYLDRFRSALLKALAELGIHVSPRPGSHGILGRTGQLAALGITVRDGVAYHGAIVNVCPSMGLLRLIPSEPSAAARSSCLMAERGQPVKMTSVRAELVRQLTEAFGCDRYHLHTGHPAVGKDECRNQNVE